MALKQIIQLLSAIAVCVIIFFSIYFISKKDKNTETINNAIYDQDFINSMTWQWENSVKSNERVLLRWNATKEDITVLVIAATTGYVGIGFSHDRAMNGSDIVIGWVKDGQAFLQDFHAIGNSQPILDSQQDYDLLFGMENKTHTILCFKRKLNTCDKEDFKITESTLALLWALNNDDPTVKPSYHKRNKGSWWINLLDENFEAQSLKDAEYIEVGKNQTRIPYKFFSFYYLCQIIKIPNFGEKHHYIGFKAIIHPKYRQVIHHILIYQCYGYNFDEFLNDTGHFCFKPENFLKETACRQEIVNYPAQSDSEFLPPNIGYPFGSTDTKPMYFLVQFHYEFSYQIKDFEDTSTVRLYHTKHLRQYEASTMNVATKYFEIIPAKQKEFPTIGMCSPSCLKTYLPPTGINIFSIIFHGHRSVTKIRLHQIRDGVKIKTVSNENFRFEFPISRYLKEEVVVQPNDMLAIECVHDTMNRTRTTESGMSSYQEMCIAILKVYPAVDLALCYSSLIPEDIGRITGSYIFSQNDIVDFYQIPFVFLSYYVSMQIYLHSRPLDNKQASEIRNLYLKGQQFPFCLNGSSPLEYSTNERVTFASETLKENKEVCSPSSNDKSSEIKDK